MAGQRRGRTGRGWDAAPPRSRADASADIAADTSDEAQTGQHAPRAGVARRGGRGAGTRGRSEDRRWDASGGAPAAPADPAERAREICLRQLAVRPRTRQELASALRQRGIAPEVAAEVLDRYGEVGIIDDQAFARAWVTSRHHGKGLARRALAGELRRKGVDPDAVGAALEEIGGDTEAETARALVERKLRSERGGAPDATLRRLVGMLARKGYAPALAFRVVKEALADRADTTGFEEAFDAELVEAELALTSTDDTDTG